MNKKIKEIMRLSFHDNFFLDRYSRESNFEYLDNLVDLVLSNGECDNYEEIANKIWILDKRIKNIFIPNMEIMPICFNDIYIDEKVFERCIEVQTIEDIKRIARCSRDFSDFKKKFEISLVMYNWEKLEVQQRRDIFNCILTHLYDAYGIKIENGEMYKVKVHSNNVRLNIALNEFIYWLSNKLNIKFIHQTCAAIDLLPYYEKIEMYFEINKELSLRNYNTSNNYLDSIMGRIIKPIVPEYEEGESDFLFSEMSNSEKNMTNAYIYLYDELCTYIHDTVQAKLFCAKELKEKSTVIQKKQDEIELLHKSIAKLQYDIQKISKDRDITKTENEEERKMVEKELFSLREYIFKREHEYAQEELEDEKMIYNGNYARVVIFGGHSSWQKKVIERLAGINILSTDQNVIDWAFMNRIDIVVIVSNYISHSMYYRVIDKVRNQKLIYLDYKNIDQMKRELDAILLKINKE